MNAPLPTRTRPLTAIAPLCAVVFLEFLAMGLPLPVLPAQVHATLGFGAVVVGLVLGAQSWATLATRHAAGTRSDRRGPRDATTRGLAVSALAGVAYAASTVFTDPSASLALLLVGRVVLGLGESLVVTGALAWGVALAGRERSGAVMSWIGIAMYSAMAVGAPLGAALAARVGFGGVAAACAIAPLAGLVAVRLAADVAPAGGVRAPFYRVAAMIALPGAGLALSALGFGAIAAFSALHFAERGWDHAALAMTAFGAAYAAARVFFGGLPDRFGGARIAALSAAVAGAGQLLLWWAPSGAWAVVGAAVTGLGFSLAFPAFGVEAIKRVPPPSRGVALGAYAACFDLTMGVGVPLLGAIAGGLGYGAAFAVSAGAAAVSLVVAVALMTRSAS